VTEQAAQFSFWQSTFTHLHSFGSDGDITMKSIVLSDHKDSPFSLVTFAYQAGLRSQGIPGCKSLITAHKRQRISGLDIIQKAVEANLIPAQLLSDQAYVQAVENCIYFYYLKHPESSAISVKNSVINKFRLQLSNLAKRVLTYSLKLLKLFFKQAYRNAAPKQSCTQLIDSKRVSDQNWHFEKQLLMLKSWF
jgi:hypothetical protein